MPSVLSGLSTDVSCGSKNDPGKPIMIGQIMTICNLVERHRCISSFVIFSSSIFKWRKLKKNKEEMNWMPQFTWGTFGLLMALIQRSRLKEREKNSRIDRSKEEKGEEGNWGRKEQKKQRCGYRLGKEASRSRRENKEEWVGRRRRKKKMGGKRKTKLTKSGRELTWTVHVLVVWWFYQNMSLNN